MASAQEFNEVFDEVVGAPLLALGAVQRGRRVVFADRYLQAALLRVEHRWQPPAELLLVVRHEGLRGSDDRLAAEAPTSPLEYPVKIAPSAAAVLEGGWPYDPALVGSHRGEPDAVPYPDLTPAECRDLLAPIAATLVDVLPRIASSLTARDLLARLNAGGGRSWIEQRWIADLEALVD